MLSVDVPARARGEAVAEPSVAFGHLLRKMRTAARLTQEELAEAAGLSPRSISDLERGISRSAHKETVRLLADALHLFGLDRAEFEAVARGRMPGGAAGPGAAGVAGTAGVAAAMRTLPRDIASFTGRQQELTQLVQAVAAMDGVVNIHAIGGMAGVGKTAFAVHVAHRLADHFPAGQIFLPLHGHTPGQQPVEPAGALASLLLVIGVPAAQIPSGLEARMALWRDRLAVKQLLLVLDDAVSSEQVRPLLPGAGRSLVLVTSRRHLSALEDATAISLDTLPPREAAALLVRLAGRTGLSPEDPAVCELTRLCGYLPLAIGMLARQLRHHPAWSAAGRAAELAAARDRLELMVTENLSAAAALNLSYADLTGEQQQLFRRLGLHPGADIDAYAAAALDGTDLATARIQLEGLYERYLITELVRGRYRMHDLVREHARALAHRLDTDDDRERATNRVLDYYQFAAALADALIARQVRPRPAAAACPFAVPDLTSREHALAWARAERASLLRCLDHGAGTGQHARVIALTAALAGLWRHDGPWAEAITRHTAAVAAARLLGDELARAGALDDLGDLLRMTGDYPAAAHALEQALDIYRDLADRLGQANALNDLGAVRRVTADHRAAAEAHEQALGIYRDLDDRRGQANAFYFLGMVRWKTGDYPAAAQAQEQALGIYLDLGDRLGQANALNYLGIVRRGTGDYAAAAQAQEQALGIYRDLGYPYGQANALNELGFVRLQTCDYPAAAQAQEEALGIYRDVGDPLGQAHALNYLGVVRLRTGDYPAAAQAQEQALRTYRDLGYPFGQASALNELGFVLLQTGDYPAAVQAQEQALGIYRDLGNPFGQAAALRCIGDVWLRTGDFPAAAQALDQALGIYRDLGNRYGEVAVLHTRGTLHRVCGELAQAEGCHQRSLEFARAIASPWDEAHALAGLGRCAMADGNLPQAENLLRQALDIFEKISAAEAPDLRAEVDALTGAPPAR
jgi:tetratricopeptide (TPR) repeat protein/DNA-binding XRE family transcriptional regulator